jgi:hypothetical protein
VSVANVSSMHVELSGVNVVDGPLIVFVRPAFWHGVPRESVLDEGNDEGKG